MAARQDALERWVIDQRAIPMTHQHDDVLNETLLSRQDVALDMEWNSSIGGPEAVELSAPSPMPHQQRAVKKVLSSFGRAEDGTLMGMGGPGAPISRTACEVGASAGSW